MVKILMVLVSLFIRQPWSLMRGSGNIGTLRDTLFALTTFGMPLEEYWPILIRIQTLIRSLLV